MNNPWCPWCESCARKNQCYGILVKPKCYMPITNSTNCRRCKYFTTEKCHECFGFELFTDSGYVTELNERSNK